MITNNNNTKDKTINSSNMTNTNPRTTILSKITKVNNSNMGNPHKVNTQIKDINSKGNRCNNSSTPRLIARDSLIMMLMRIIIKITKILRATKSRWATSSNTNRTNRNTIRVSNIKASQIKKDQANSNSKAATNLHTINKSLIRVSDPLAITC
mmetsp:Transcript_16163/g.13715  ORF Transcript_16163/g.13715 Transcript_16163/m.13715 type:complete len:153 (-) Transcript_16163:1300-1758(-)